MDINDFRAYITLATFLTFLGICWWAYRGSNRARFEEDAMMAFNADALGDAGFDSQGEAGRPTAGSNDDE